jgi:hypothetical protein
MAASFCFLGPKRLDEASRNAKIWTADGRNGSKRAAELRDRRGGCSFDSGRFRQALSGALRWHWQPRRRNWIMNMARILAVLAMFVMAGTAFSQQAPPTENKGLSVSPISGFDLSRQELKDLDQRLMRIR